MMVKIKRSGRFYYVSDNDCYIFYYLFRFKLHNSKCYFSKKQLKRVIYTLSKRKIPYELNGNINNGNCYDYYLSLGKNKVLFDKSLFDIENKLYSIIDNKSFNKIYKKIEELMYGR